MRLVLRSRTFFWILLVSVTLLGAFLRLYALDRVPLGLYPDEAMNGTDALEAAETGNYELFYPDNFGREGLYINLQAIAIKLLGPTIPALRLPSALFGALAVLGTGLLAWELFRSRYAALIAAFLSATSYWAINFSRIGFRAIMLPALLSLSLFFFFRGLRKGNHLPFALAGLLFGLGLHTYVAFRLAPLILILVLPFLALSYEAFFRRFWKHAIVFVIGAAITAAPMFYLFATDPSVFSSRSAAVSIFSPEVNGGHFFATFGKTVGLSLIKYNFVGDMNWRHNYPPYPVLDPLAGAFFLAGIIFSVVMIVRTLGDRLRTGRRDTELAVHALLLIGFAVMLMPEFLTNEGLPHALSAIGTQPFVFLFATIPLMFLFRSLSRSRGGTRLGLAAFLAIALGASATWNATKYFVFFAENRAQYASFNADFRNMAEYLVTLPEETVKYVIPGSFVERQPIIYLTHGRTGNVVFTDGTGDLAAPSVVIPMKDAERTFSEIREAFPDASAIRVDLRPGTDTDFTAIIIP